MLLKLKENIFKLLYILILIYLLIFVPSFFGHKPLVVVSGSMQPVLKVGGILYYEETNIKDFKKDDILVFELNDHTISHRIVDIKDDYFITKGDANSSVDSYEVYHSQVIGKGTNWSIPYLGYYADFIYTHKYLLFLSIILIITDLCNDYYKNKKRRSGESNEKS